MMPRRIGWSALLLPLVLAACEGGREPPPPVEDTAFDAQATAIDKARDVQRVTDEQARKLRQAVEDAEEQ
jgi:hypothetical protein